MKAVVGGQFGPVAGAGTGLGGQTRPNAAMLGAQPVLLPFAVVGGVGWMIGKRIGALGKNRL